MQVFFADFAWQRALSALLLIFFTFERISNTFNSASKSQPAFWYDQAFTSGMLLLYAGVVITSAGYFFYAAPQVSPVSSIVGAIILVLGIVIRRAAISQLNENWCVYISAEGIKNVEDRGVYSWSRHPYYAASIFELFGISLLLGAYFLLGYIVMIYLPLAIIRSLMEEKELLKKFPGRYEDYKIRTPFFLNLNLFIRNSRRKLKGND